ncbi:hypothetical protein H0H93_009908 [Arthromyces matolae]|nr:hypothetical protein H0H93_009908 [Arthromyces matolae]
MDNNFTSIQLPKPTGAQIVLSRPSQSSIVIPRHKAPTTWTNGSRIISPHKRSRTVSNPHVGYKRARQLDGPSFMVQEEVASVVEGTEQSFTDEVVLSPIELESTEYLDGGKPTATLWSGNDYAGYVDLVLSGGVGIAQITTDIFVVQGWNTVLHSGSKLWYHMWRSQNDDEVLVGCFCPQGRTENECHHARFMKEYGEQEFPGGRNALGADSRKVVLFSREPVGECTFVNYFSVASQRGPQDLVKSRAIVVYEGSDQGGGPWKCSKDSNPKCSHTVAAREMLQKCLQNEGMNPEEDWLEVPEAVLPPRVGRPQRAAVSYLPVMVPLWASLATDKSHYVRALPCRDAPKLLRLDSTSSCPCSSPRSLYSKDTAVEEVEATIMGLTNAFKTTIQLQACTKCRGRWRQRIGPDLRESAIFNLNNQLLFTHELLDDYTSCYTTSETPFTAWIKVVTRRYEENRSPVPFVPEQVLRTAWFAYVDLQDFTNDMTCPTCGPVPNDVIWDGVSVGFNKKHMLDTLKPPTISDAAAPQSQAQYVAKQQIIPDIGLRRALRKAIKDDAGLSGFTYDSDEEEQIQHTLRSEAARKQEAARLISIPAVVTGLAELSPFVSALFQKYFGLAAIEARVTPPARYKKLFNQLASDESVVQTLNRSALAQMKHFLLKPSVNSASSLIDCPALRQVLQAENGQYSDAVLGLCLWLHQRGSEIHRFLLRGSSPAGTNLEIKEEDWRKHDKQVENGNNRGAKCSKYYNTYKERKLTGGLMAAWCTHSICYGFHFIPKGEGRNDVFSAMFTRWPKAPKRIIYDFACALGPYCMTREAAFFGESLFMIDEFHARDHTKCAPAAFAETYMAVDPRIAHLNTSAAECGNGGLKRIRKSLSYMGQGNAIIYAKVFLSVWNRQRIRAKEGRFTETLRRSNSCAVASKFLTQFHQDPSKVQFLSCGIKIPHSDLRRSNSCAVASKFLTQLHQSNTCDEAPDSTPSFTKTFERPIPVLLNRNSSVR